MKRRFVSSLLILALLSLGYAQDPGWPRKLSKNGATLIYYQPQIDDWKDNKELYGRMAISLTPAGGKQLVGVASFRLRTDVDVATHNVLLSDIQITKTYFPSLDPSASNQMDQLARSLIPPDKKMTMSLDRLVATVDKKKMPVKTAPVKNDPPTIFVSERPAILVQMDGKPVLAPIKDNEMSSVVNVNWPLFFEKDTSKYYLLVGNQWMTTSDFQTWAPTSKLPKDMSKLLKDPNWESLKGMIPPPPVKDQPPTVFYSNTPAEVVIFKGTPVYAAIPNTQLVYATNTDNDVFVFSPTKTYYYQTAGRWFSAAKLTGPWTYASPDLPPDFKKIPSSSPAARVLVAVPGTPEAEDAVLIAQIPTTVTVDPIKAAEQVKVAYSGEPQFKPIEGTPLSYATNTQEKVIKVGDLYYVCFQGIWFQSTNPNGPWETSKSVPPEIYTIPASSPVYNVTYVTQTTTSSGSVESSYTAGYMGTFVTGMAVGACVAWGTGYYYPPYVHYGYGYPMYYPYAMTYGGYYHYGYGGYYGGYYGGARYGTAYNPATGTYARGATAYGPYGSRSVGQAYNPYTGTYARGASASTAYGSRSAGQAYNPYTGAYGATRQGSNAYSQWGSSVVTRGDQAAVGRHYSTAQGTVGSINTSEGGKVAGSSTAFGNTVAGKTASGDMYAGRDGNVYKNTGGSWQKYDNGSWNNVNTSGAQQRAQDAQQQRGSSGSYDRSSSSNMQGLQNDYQNRQRGATQSQRYQGGGGRRSGGGGRRR